MLNISERAYISIYDSIDVGSMISYARNGQVHNCHWLYTYVSLNQMRIFFFLLLIYWTRVQLFSCIAEKMKNHDKEDLLMIGNMFFLMFWHIKDVVYAFQPSHLLEGGNLTTAYLMIVNWIKETVI